MSQTVPFQTIQFSISTQFECKYSLIAKNISISSYSVWVWLVWLEAWRDLLYLWLQLKAISWRWCEKLTAYSPPKKKTLE